MSEKATHLIKVACDAALGNRPELKVFGTNFPTPDGTAIRDYIHIEDLATAHVDALRYLEQGHGSQTFNCGYGKGYSVSQVIERVKAISGADFPVIKTSPRPGDPVSVIACGNKIRQVLCWQPKYNDLDTIIRTTLDWEIKHKNLFHKQKAKVKKLENLVPQSIGLK